jgi:hypothetical protein
MRVHCAHIASSSQQSLIIKNNIELDRKIHALCVLQKPVNFGEIFREVLLNMITLIDNTVRANFKMLYSM